LQNVTLGWLMRPGRGAGRAGYVPQGMRITRNPTEPCKCFMFGALSPGPDIMQ